MAYAFNDDKSKFDLDEIINKKSYIMVEGYKNVAASGEQFVNYTEFVTDEFPDDFNNLILVSAMIGVPIAGTDRIAWTNRLMRYDIFYPEVSIKGKGSSGQNEMYILICNPKTTQSNIYYRLAFFIKE